MLSHVTIVALTVLVASQCTTIAQPKRDYLVRGDAQSTTPSEVKYDRALRKVLERAWRKDVVLRMLDLAPFGPEWAGGLTRGPAGYHAFAIGASTNLREYVARGSATRWAKTGDRRTLRQPLYERRIAESVAGRIAALWRRVLSDPRNYGKDPAIYLDTDQFMFYLAFLPTERLAARMTSWGPKVEQLTDVIDALVLYADGTISESKLVQAVAKAERKLGI